MTVGTGSRDRVRDAQGGAGSKVGTLLRGPSVADIPIARSPRPRSFQRTVHGFLGPFDWQLPGVLAGR